MDKLPNSEPGGNVIVKSSKSALYEGNWVTVFEVPIISPYEKWCFVDSDYYKRVEPLLFRHQVTKILEGMGITKLTDAHEIHSILSSKVRRQLQWKLHFKGALKQNRFWIPRSRRLSLKRVVLWGLKQIQPLSPNMHITLTTMSLKTIEVTLQSLLMDTKCARPYCLRCDYPWTCRNWKNAIIMMGVVINIGAAIGEGKSLIR